MSKEKTEKISFYKLFKRFPDEEAAHRFFAETSLDFCVNYFRRGNRPD